MENQKHLFDLDEKGIYLNGAYMSAQLKTVTEIGIENLIRKANPSSISPTDFFSHKKILKGRFAQLINAPNSENIAIIPSVSYGIANAAKNLQLQRNDEIIVIDEQFPSHIYSWQKLADEKLAKIVSIEQPSTFHDRGKVWNLSILEAINDKTAAVCICNVHWADGTKYNLKAIGEKARKHGAKLIIDGTQSVGALPISIKEYGIDVLVCGGYKWLMGPYSLGLAYYSDEFCQGQPIEENWMNRYNSEDFKGLTQYESNYKKGAERFSVGESSNFILVPMLSRAIEQILSWNPSSVQEYCKSITEEGISLLRAKGCFVEDAEYRGHHLFGVYLPNNLDQETIKNRLNAENISVSYRGNAIRVSPHVYNTKDDFLKFVNCIY